MLEAGSDAAQVRIEHDSPGKIEVPDDALYGAQTARAVRNFTISGRRLAREEGIDQAMRFAGTSSSSGESGNGFGRSGERLVRFPRYS